VKLTVPEPLLEPTPPLIEPPTDNDLDVLDAMIENNRRAGICFTRNAELVRTIKAIQSEPAPAK